MRKVWGLCILVLTVLFLVFPIFISHADELDDLNKQLDSLNTELKSKEADHASVKKQLDGIKSQVAFIEQEIVKKEKEVREGEKTLGHQKELLNERARSYYKNINKNSFTFINLFISENFSVSFHNFFYQKTLVDEDRNTIIELVLYIKDVEDKKTSLVREKTELAKIKDEVDRQSKLLGDEIAGTKQKIAQLSARQQSLIASKLASLNIPRSAGTSARGCSDDRGVDPGFSPRLAFFTYGAPHRNGLNQYGAKGRADAGQNAEQMLGEYYPNLSLKKDYDQNAQVNVDGNGTFSIEDYTKRIYEVPADWPMETLKAQAVAARTYALNSMQRNGHICTTEACQVFQANEKGGRWNEAVDATKGWVMMDGGAPGFTQYASTHGGYILNLGKFDGSGGTPGSFGELNERAYDKASPWFYCDWGARGEYSNTAWLKTNEVADIVNAISLAKRDASIGEHLYQTDKPNPAGTDTWDSEKVKSELRSRGGSAYNNVSDISMSVDFGSGKTSSVNVSGDAGSTSFSASEFKDWFNLRAPANIQIVGPLFNAEKR